MDKKKILLIALGCAAAALIGAALLFSGGNAADTPPGTQPPVIYNDPTRPILSEQPGQTDGTDATEPEVYIPEQTEPRYTEPEQIQPEDTEPEVYIPEQTEPRYPEPEQTDPPVWQSIRFPVEIDGGLVAQSLFQFSGMNPDADNMFGENIAGIQMTNTSDDHIDAAEITAVLGDGTTLTFRAEDIPAGGTVMAFCLEHDVLRNADMCEELFGWAEFSYGDPLCSDQVSIRVSGTEVTLTNVSGRDLTNLDVICRGLLDNSGFGGITYTYHVNLLPAGKTAVIHAEDCILGMTEVVRIHIGG